MSFWNRACCTSCWIALYLFLSSSFLSGEDATRWNAPINLTHAQTIPDLGAGQGVAWIDGKVYLYGDAATGVIREYELDHALPSLLRWTGLEIQLTRNGVDLLTHPTGLTHHPEWGTFLGDTVNQRGTIFHIDWERAKADGHLDHAILNMVNDDLAINGTRPEFVSYAGRILIATSDYGDQGNELRLYDPQHLGRVSRTSSPGVLVDKRACGPWVQSLSWSPEDGALVLVQNQIEGLRYRLTAIDLQASESHPGVSWNFCSPCNELEGFRFLPGGVGLFLNSSPEQNVYLEAIDLEIE